MAGTGFFLRTRSFVPLVLIFLTTIPTVGQELKLVPYPREVQVREGRFAITPRTRIVIATRHRREDRAAAEMLAEEIQSTTGKKVAISAGASSPGVVYLTRISGKPPVSDPLFQEQGYTLECSRNRIVVAGASAAGLLYGVQTLRQLLVPDGKRLACSAVSVTDWPAMRWRGLHDDLSRGPIPRLDFLKKQVRILAEYKMNMLSLYMEDVFDYTAHPLLAPKEAALTPKDAAELVKYAAQYYVTIVPEQEAFGHLHNILRNELYTDLAETPHGHVLAPVQPGSYALIKSMFDELNAVFPSPFLHIGADETFELGRGQTKVRADEVGLGRVYLEFLQRIAQIMQPYHKRLIFWGDIAVKYPDLLNVLPKDVIADAWAYDPKDNFDASLKPYKDAGLDLFVSPGVSNWSVIFPNLDKAYPNIARFVRDGQKYGALGMFNTNWNDSGESLIGLTWSPTILGAACSWQLGECSIPQFEATYDWAFYRNQDATFNEVLANLNRANSLLKNVGLSQSQDEYLWTDPFTPAGARFTQRALPVAHDLRIAAEKALESLYRNRSRARLHAETLDPLILAANRLDFLGMKIQFADEIARYYWEAYEHLADGAAVRRNLREITGTNARLDDLRDATTRGRDLYRDEWLKENHPFWLGNVLLRYDHLADLWQSKILAVKAARQQHGADKTLPPPEQLGFYRAGPATPAATSPQAQPPTPVPPARQ